MTSLNRTALAEARSKRVRSKSARNLSNDHDHNFFSQTLILSSIGMADPTKAETDAVFKVLRAQKGNKVRTVAVPLGIAHRVTDVF